MFELHGKSWWILLFIVVIIVVTIRSDLWGSHWNTREEEILLCRSVRTNARHERPRWAYNRWMNIHTCILHACTCRHVQWNVHLMDSMLHLHQQMSFRYRGKCSIQRDWFYIWKVVSFVFELSLFFLLIIISSLQVYICSCFLRSIPGSGLYSWPHPAGYTSLSVLPLKGKYSFRNCLMFTKILLKVSILNWMYIICTSINFLCVVVVSLYMSFVKCTC